MALNTSKCNHLMLVHFKWLPGNIYSEMTYNVLSETLNPTTTKKIGNCNDHRGTDHSQSFQELTSL